MIPLEGDAGTVRVIAGAFGTEKGPARTFTPIDLWDMRLAAKKTARFRVPEGHAAALLFLRDAGHLRLVGIKGGQSVLARTFAGDLVKVPDELANLGHRSVPVQVAA